MSKFGLHSSIYRLWIITTLLLAMNISWLHFWLQILFWLWSPYCTFLNFLVSYWCQYLIWLCLCFLYYFFVNSFNWAEIRGRFSYYLVSLWSLWRICPNFSFLTYNLLTDYNSFFGFVNMNINSKFRTSSSWAVKLVLFTLANCYWYHVERGL